MRFRALEYAKRQHEGQKRDEGTPYFSHIEGVVEILQKEFGIEDEETLTVAALHDTIEDTSTTFKDIENMFGTKIAICTDLLTKKKDLSKEEYFKNIFENCEYNIVPKVKLADRIHNMRCLIYTNKIEKVIRKIEETKENILIYENEENAIYMQKIRDAIKALKEHFKID